MSNIAFNIHKYVKVQVLIFQGKVSEAMPMGAKPT